MTEKVDIKRSSTPKSHLTNVEILRYGLCASVWSQNVGRVHRVSQQLEVKPFFHFFNFILICLGVWLFFFWWGDGGVGQHLEVKA